MRGEAPASILMVDDDTHVLRSLRAALESHGYRVRSAVNGPTALEACAVERPDVVLLDLARRDEEPVIQAGGLVIDLVARRVMVDGREVHLTPTEYELLRVLATNPDRVLTHGYLLRTALGSGYEDALDNLRTFIAQLRRKLEHEPSRPRWIVTEPAVGYRFRPDA